MARKLDRRKQRMMRQGTDLPSSGKPREGKAFPMPSPRVFLIATAVMVVLIVGATIGLTIGRRGQHSKPGPQASSERASAADKAGRPSPRPAQAPSHSTPAPPQRSSSIPPVAHRPPSPSPQQPATGTITGTVTYYFNHNYPHIPDSVTKVYVLSGSVNECPMNWMFVALPVYRKVIYSEYTGAEGQPHLPSMDHEIPMVDSCLCDKNGTFRIRDVPVGTYTVILESEHVAGPTNQVRDAARKHVWRVVTIAAGREVDISYDFGMKGI